MIMFTKYCAAGQQPHKFGCGLWKGFVQFLGQTLLSHFSFALSHSQPQGPRVEQKHAESMQQSHESCCSALRGE